MADVIYQMVHYREFSHGDAKKKDIAFEDLLRAQLSAKGASGLPRWEAIEDRLFPLPNPGGLELVLNRVADLASAVFGEMCLLHPNGVQALLQLTAEKHKLSQLTLAEIYSLSEAGAPAGSKYVRGLCYFLAIGNHLFFIRNQSLTPEHLNDYFAWLLTLQPDGLAPDSKPDFQSRFDRAAIGGNIGDVKALRVSGPAFPQMIVKPDTPAQEKERAVTRKIAEKFVEFGQAFELASTLLGPARATKLAESLGPKERLVVDATVKIRGTRTEQSKAQMKSLATELDSLTEGKITVEGNDGKMTDKDVILRTNMPFEVDKNGTTLLNFDNVADQLQEVYKRFVADQKIKA